MVDSFEPAFAYHQLQQVWHAYQYNMLSVFATKLMLIMSMQRINALDQQKSMIERKRVEIRPRRSSVAQDAAQGDFVQPCSNMDEILKV